MKFFMGIIFGVVLSFGYLALGPKGTETKARIIGSIAKEKAESVQYDYCKKEFLEESQCFQKLPSAECDAEIKKKCGGN